MTARRPTLLLGAALLLFLAAYLYLLRNVGLANDEWTFLLYRSTGFQAIVSPYNNGPVVGEILLYRLWSNTIGVGHHWVLSCFYALLQCTIVVLVFAMARRRVGRWPALGVAMLALVVGRAWETVLFPATLTFVSPALAGCAAWFALEERGGWPAQLGVAALLAIASVTGGLGPALVLGLLVEVAVTRRWQWLWVLALGVAPLIAWYAGEARYTAPHFSTNLPHLPLWAIKYVVASAGATVGLPPWGGVAVLALATVGMVVRQRASRMPSLRSPRAIGLLTTLVAAVLTIGAARAADTPPTSSRYLYFPAIVLLLLACEWLRELDLLRARAPLALGAAVAVMAVVLGALQLRHGKVFYETHADGTAARMGAVVIASGPPLVVEPSRLAYTPATVSAFIRRFGAAPIDTSTQLVHALPESRAAADQLLVVADVRRPGWLNACSRVSAGSPLPDGDVTVTIAARQPTHAELVRFANPGAGPAFAVRPPRIAFGLRADTSLRPWRLFVAGSALVQVCRR